MRGVTLFALVRVIGFALFIAFVAGASLETRAQTSADIITAIRVIGNQRIDSSTVRSYMLVGVGDRFDTSRVDRSLKALYATGHFADVGIRRDGNTIVVRVLENPVINQVVFEGNNELDDDTLGAEVQLRPRIVYTRTRVKADAQRIVQLYQRSGRFAARVEPKVIQHPSNRVDVVFEIHEGEVTGIRRVNFIGNERFTDGRLGAIVSTKRKIWYRFFSSDDTYDPDRLTFDRELLRRFYLSRGYADFRVLTSVAELSQDREGFFVTFSLEEGEQYRFGEVKLETELKALDTGDLVSNLKTQSGTVFNADLLEKTVQELTFAVGRLGFAFVDIRPRTKRDRENRLVNVTFDIREGPKTYVERINISGNIRTLDKVIRREFRIIEGDAFNAALLRRSRQRIRRLGFFEKVELTQSAGKAPDQTVVEVEVEERATGELNFTLGFSTADALIGGVGIRERNLLGRGQDLSAAAQLSFRQTSFDISFTEPYFLKRDLSAGFNIFLRQTDFSDFSAFDQRSVGARFRTSFPLTELLRFGLRYEIRNDRVEDIESDASRFILSQEGSTTESSIGYSLTLDLRDDPIIPRAGYLIRFTQKFAGLGGDLHFLESIFNYTLYYPWTENFVTKLNMIQGYIVGLGEDIRLTNRFFIGTTKFRGFAPGGIGPRDIVTGDAIGGTIYFVGTIEQRFPLGLPEELGILGRVFTDFGTLTDSNESGPGIADSASTRVSAGIGISWKSPLGPVALDLAVPLLKEDVDETEVLRFNFGTRF